MAQLFGHEKLKVYQKGLGFAAIRSALLDGLSRRVAACDHLDRGAESILVNIAHASSSWCPRERIVYLGHANGSALECAGCLDVFVAKSLLAPDDIGPGKHLLAEIVSILITMRKTTGNRVREDHAEYRTKKGNLFSHEDLDVYQAAIQLIACLRSSFVAAIYSPSSIKQRLRLFSISQREMVVSPERIRRSSSASHTSRQSGRHHLLIWLRLTDLRMLPEWVGAASC